MKTFKYTTDLKDNYGVRQFGLKKGDIFYLIDTNISGIEKTSDTHSVYLYNYTISIPNDTCYILDSESWSELIMYSKYVSCYRA